MTNINFRIPEKDRDRFHKACRRQGDIPSQVLRRLIADYVAGRIQYNIKQETGNAGR